MRQGMQAGGLLGWALLAAAAGVVNHLDTAARLMPDVCMCNWAGFGEARRRGARERASVSDLRAAYASGASTPEAVAEAALAALGASESRRPAMRMLIACDPADVRRQAAESAARCGLGSGKKLGAHPFRPAMRMLTTCDAADVRRRAAHSAAWCGRGFHGGLERSCHFSRLRPHPCQPGQF